ncbi:MAG TPA: hypothetical protein PKW33_04465 [Anaerolineaceae bacterium]|nr:hypothetical protein [Anaerolineaceae bacterium]HPN50816.1 hypothetical protein [Anaerolineaceae bacterium]
MAELNEFKEMVDDTVFELLQVAPYPREMGEWVTYFLASLDKRARVVGDEKEFEEMLKGLNQGIKKRLETGRWPSGQ